MASFSLSMLATSCSAFEAYASGMSSRSPVSSLLATAKYAALNSARSFTSASLVLLAMPIALWYMASLSAFMRGMNEFFSSDLSTYEKYMW